VSGIFLEISCRFTENRPAAARIHVSQFLFFSISWVRCIPPGTGVGGGAGGVKVALPSFKWAVAASREDHRLPRSAD